MAPKTEISITELSLLKTGGVLVTFSNEEVVLYHAKFLYDVRHQDHNIEVDVPALEEEFGKRRDIKP